LEDIAVAADPDPYFALPSLYGAPAYGRVLKAVVETERPLDADDLPIAVEQTEDERVLANLLQASGSYQAGNGLRMLGADGYHGARLGVGPRSNGSSGSNGSNGSNGTGGPTAGVGGRRFSLRSLTHRLGPHQK
jgi:hypothetical protein